MNDREVWMPVRGSVIYEVSNLGRVKNAVSGAFLRPARNRGYEHVALYEASGVSRTTYLHVMVLTAFCGPPPFDDAEACHNNGTRHDNRLANLRWGARIDNVEDRIRHGRQPFGTRMHTSKLTEADVRQMRAEYLAGKSTYAMAKERKLSTNTTWSAITGKTWKHVEGAINNAR